MNSKTITIVSILILNSFISNAQFFDQNFAEINKKNEKKARALQTKCQSSNVFEYWVNFIKNKRVKYYSVASYVFSNDITSFDSSSNIIDFLVLDKESTLHDYIGIKKICCNEYITLCDFEVYMKGNVYYTREGLWEVKLDDYKFVSLESSSAWNHLKNRNFDFLFSVDHFEHIIWFIENKKVFLIDLKDSSISEPDEYIKRKKYSINDIRQFGK